MFCFGFAGNGNTGALFFDSRTVGSRSFGGPCNRCLTNKTGHGNDHQNVVKVMPESFSPTK